MTQILQLAPRAPAPHARPRTSKRTRAVRRQALSATAIGAVAATLTGLSLSHLATGIQLATSAPEWQSWAMAVGIDLGFVALELSQLSIAEKLRRQVARYARPAIMGTLAGSAVLNAAAFASGANGLLMQAGAVVMGVAIPALIYALTRVGAALYIDCGNKA